MYICLNCNYRSESHSNYCPNCGQPMATVTFEQPRLQVYDAPPVREDPAPAPQNPVPQIPASVSLERPAAAAPEASAEAPAKVSVLKRVITLVLAIIGVEIAVYGMDIMLRFEESGRGFELYTLYSALATCLLCVPGSLLSLLFVRSHRKKGDSSVLDTISRIIAFVGLGLAAYMLYIGITAVIALL